MPDFRARIADGLARAGEHAALAVVPVLFALLDVEKLQSIVAFDSVHLGVRSGLPLSVVTVWQFVTVPSSGVSVNAGAPVQLLPLAFVTVPVLVVAQTALTAGYFGSIRNALDREPYQFVANSRRYFLPFLVLTALPYLVAVPAALGVFGLGSITGDIGVAALPVLLLGLVVSVVVSYLFYATPYLLVLRDTGLVAAARQSYTLAVQGGPYAAYAVGFALFVLVVSPFATAVVVNIPFLGALVGVLAGGYLGLGANVATMRFVADVDPGSSVTTNWAADPPDSDTDHE
ncbi:hypothetical protein [Haloarcula laminariae]|uniref:hypothetical protein n=1 Tax=Haloarcula laminariae TaxID=2961577 RepID=UPI0021C8DDC1|nr:hypothetical protein [Halomicroarcula laminariae]